MTTANLKPILLTFMDQVWNRGDFSRLDELVSDTYEVKHDPGDAWEGQVLNHAAFEKRVLYSRNAFPDLHFAIQEMVEEGGRVVASWIMTGTHEGDLSNLPATGRQFSVSGITIYTFDGHRVSGHTQAFDRLGFLSQIGFMG